MDQSLLLELLNSLTHPEKQLVLALKDIVFFNNGKFRKQASHLVDICMSAETTQVKLDKTHVYKLIFPESAFTEGKLEKVMVEALKIVKTTLLITDLLKEEKSVGHQITIAKIFLSKGLDKRFQTQLVKAQKNLDDLTKNSEYFKQLIEIENIIHEYECISNQKKGDLNITKLLFSIEIKNKLDYVTLFNRLLLQQRISKIDVPSKLHETINSFTIEEESLQESPILEANFKIFKLLRNILPEPSGIRELLDFIKKFESEIDQESLQEFYAYARNLCVIHMNNDIENKEIGYILNTLYKDNLERGLLHYNGKLHPSRYWAVSSNAIRVKDFNWAKKFIEQYKDQIIGENDTKDIYRLNMANYLFYIGEYSTCLDFIPATSLFLDYQLHGKRLEVMALYESKSELLPYKLDAFKVFLSRTSPKILAEDVRQLNADFVNFLFQIVSSIPGDLKRADTVIRRINEKKRVAEWRWLMDKAVELKRK
ncbi:MAG TPA: hypothetical protein VK168_11580 [Saprospiraceae bacterium]|nr:hypothetical protein [Saprospiraceae bacterium]